MYIITAIRLLIIPCLVFFTLRQFFSETILLGVPVLLSAMPVASSTIFIAEEYGGDVKAATKGVFLSTLLCMVTLPLIGYMLL
jgi:predicted permease